jgi:hypothetical protein
LAFTKARPREMTEPLLSNPGKGCATFQRFNGDPLNEGTGWSEEGPLVFAPAREAVAAGYLPSTVAYCRWFWNVLEPESGRLDFSMIEGALAMGRACGQSVQVRLMPFGAHGQPQLPDWYRAKYRATPSREHGPGKAFLEPDYASPEYFDRWGRVIAEFGRRFDGHPDLESVDTAFIGPWGEGAGNPSQKTVDRFLNLYMKVHRKTVVLANTDGPQFAAGVRRGTGWRCDCYGDLRRRGSGNVPNHLGWNHTFEAYPQQVHAARATEVWRARPVVFETCATPLTWFRTWFTEPGDLELVLNQGYKFHVSVFMPKSNLIPREYLRPLAAFCDRIGYRFVLRQVKWASTVKRGGALSTSWWIENTGVAPVYRRVVPAMRFAHGRGDVVVTLPEDARRWLPGDVIIDRAVRVPRGLARGRVRVFAGLVEPGHLRPVARFASEGADAAGWLPLGEVRCT